MKKTFGILLTLALVLSLSVVAVPAVEASGTNYYVSTSGNNTDTGLGWAHAWRDIQYAVDTVNAGDTINVAAGTYTETGGPFYTDHYGLKFDATRDGITLKGANAGIPGYDSRGPESIIEGPAVLHGNAVFIFDGADGVVIDGFTLKAGDDIVENRADDVVIKNNIITPISGTPADTQAPGIFACECTNMTVSYNWILDIGMRDNTTGGCAIYLGLSGGGYPVTNSLIEHNLIDNSNGTGILAYDTTGGGITIRCNTIRDVGTSGLYLDDGIRAGAYGSGLTIEYNDIYNCTNRGIQINHAAASHTIHYNSIYGNGQYGVRNTDAATVDASANWWGSSDPTTVAGMISGGVDFTPLLDSGTDTDPATPGFQPSLSSLTVHTLGSQSGSTGRIQEGVNLVSGSTVHVAAGTYAEQLTINKSLTLIGAGAGTTTIQAPGVLTGDKAIVNISGGGVNVDFSGFTVKGPGPGTSNSIFAGIFVHGTANADIHDNYILDIRDNPLSGGQDPHGIWVGSNAKGTTGTATIQNNTITGYQKGGIAVEGAGSSATIGGLGNTITGAGPITALAQDAIRVAFGAGPVSIKGNTISANEYDGGSPDWTCWGGAAIFLREGAHDIDIEGNTITANRYGILIGHGGDTHSVDKVNITNNDITGQLGEGVHLQCFGGVAPPTNVHITCNDIQSSYDDCSYYDDQTWGIIVDYGAAGPMTGNYAHYNNITGTPYIGLWNGKEGPGGDIPDFDAENNWWGDASGPTHTSNPGGMGDNVTDNVDFTPWLGETPAPTKGVATSTGTGTASFTTSQGNIKNLAAVATPSFASFALPHGMFSFEICCIDPGQTVTLTITLPKPLPAGAKWWKYRAGKWYWLPIGSNNGDNIITITLTDGVFPGDADSIAGQITDPGGPGYVVAACGFDISSTEGGSVTTPGEGVFCYVCGTVVDLVASPDAGYKFVNWSGDVSTIADVHDASTTISVQGWYSITANFASEATPTVEHTLTISSTGGGSVTTPGEGTFPYDAGTVVSLVASPANGYKFVNWTGDGISHPDFDTTTITMNGDYSIKANFAFEQTTTDSTEGSSGPLACFIATAAYGTPTAEQIDVLREFRDAVLLESAAGSQFVTLYYQLSPPIADFVAGNELLRTLVRELLVDPVVWVVDATGAMWRN